MSFGLAYVLTALDEYVCSKEKVTAAFARDFQLKDLKLEMNPEIDLLRLVYVSRVTFVAEFYGSPFGPLA